MKKIYLLITLLAMVGLGFGQTRADISENFDGLSESSYGNYDYNGFHIDNGLCSSQNARSGNAVRLRNATTYLEYQATDGNGKDGGVGTISFWYRSWDSSPTAIYDVKVNINGAGWSTIGNQISTTSTTYAEWSYDLNDASDNILIKVERVSGERLHIDDFSITDYSVSSVDNPVSFNSTTASSSEIDLTWTQNGNSDDVMVAWSSDGTFGTPADGTTYSAGNSITGGGTVLYNGSAISYNHTSLTAGTQYFYKAFSVDGSVAYSAGVTDDATTFKNEPSNHVSGFAAGEAGATTIPVTWSDNDGAVVADGYLLFINTTGTFTAPVDGTSQSDDTDVSDGSGQVNVAHGTESYRWKGLAQNTQYFFAIYPYTNSGTAIDYKVDGTIPTASATTTVVFGAPDLFISEYIEGSGNNKALEIYNGTGADVDLSAYQIWKISNGGSWPESTLSLSGILSNGDVYVIYNSGASAEIVAAGDVTWGSATWNGDDAVGLAKDDGTGNFVLLDAVGEDGSDPGSGWDVAGVTNATKDHTLVRKSSILKPNTNWASSAGTTTENSEWVVYDNNDLTYIGYHITNAPPVPLSNWAILLAVLFIMLLFVVNYRRKIA